MPADTPDYGGQTRSPQDILFDHTGIPLAATQFNLPQGCHALAVLFTSSATTTITGTQSGVLYFQGTAQPNQLIIVPVVSALDTQLTISVGGTFNPNVRTAVVAIYDTAAVAVFGTQQSNAFGQTPVFVVANSVGAGQNSPPPPQAGNIVAGNANVGGTTLITIPATRTWVGNAWLTGVSGSGGGELDISTVGTTVTPSAGTILLKTDTPPSANQPVNAALTNIVVSAGSSAATLKLTIAGSGVTGDGGVNGVLY